MLPQYLAMCPWRWFVRAEFAVKQCSPGVWPGSVCNTRNRNSTSRGRSGIPASSRALEGSGSGSGSLLGSGGMCARAACMGDSDWGASSCAHCTHVIKAQPRREGSRDSRRRRSMGQIPGRGTGPAYKSEFALLGTTMNSARKGPRHTGTALHIDK